MKLATLLLPAISIAFFVSWSQSAVASPKFWARTCPLRKWRRVTKSMIQSKYKIGVKLTHHDVNGGLVIRGSVYSYGCGKGHGSGAATYIRGNWVQIRYTQEFRGSASCWKIFGTTASPRYSSNFAFYHNPLQRIPTMEMLDYSAADGDGIFNEHHMNSRSNHKFDGRVYRCDNERDNFWHLNNGGGLRRATVMLRRKSALGAAGILTETSCGTPSYVIKDIYVLM